MISFRGLFKKLEKSTVALPSGGKYPKAKPETSHRYSKELKHGP
jgi:hypothetical protein